MTFISYSQNFEDVMLWRALKHVDHGFWIDVGAADPTQDSVTRAFSDRSWRGINIEANPTLLNTLVAARPRDVNLGLAAGRSDGSVHFFEVVDTGLSTVDAAIADRHRAAGFQVREHEVPLRTLASICAEHAPREVHFLKIDVEGAEAEVLAGADFRACRPWIVLVEATLPLSQEPTYRDWESILLQSDYRFAWFDGLNRFYIADERWEELSPAFAAPPNVFDDFTLRRVVEADERTAQAESRAVTVGTEAAAETARWRESAAAAAARADSADVRLRETESKLVHSQQQTAIEAARANTLERTFADARLIVSRLQQAEVKAAADLAGIRASTSWRITAPLRAIRLLGQARFGAALMEVGIQRSRAERLKRVAGERGGPAKKAMRASIYLAGRGAARLPGTERLDLILRRLIPGPWEWMRLRNAAYLAAAQREDGAHVPPVASYRALPTSTAAASGNSGSAALTPVRYAAAGGDWTTSKVHQFHSGSSPGDAITNSLLLIRDRLRSLGYESEIFVEHRHLGLAKELLEIGDLPEHGDYVLIVHHSMGYDTLDRILALPARKVLVYHNITPPNLLEGSPHYAAYAQLGREQLHIMRPHMVAALSDSEYNALELREAGYHAPLACPLLFDVSALQARAAGKGQQDGPRDARFTVLFVGRIVASKAQAELVDAFAAFRRLRQTPSRLVLVGRADGADASYPQEIQRRIDLHGLAQDVVLTGAVSDEELDDWYRAADLYVSLSCHEGFGVPLVEAMAYGVPVLAWPAGAVPYTLAGGGVLLTDRSPEAVGRAMRDLADNPDQRAHIVTRQREVLEGFRLERHVPVLLRTLAMAGAPAPRNDVTAKTAVAANLQVTVMGHINGTYSLAAVNRTMAIALERRHPGTVRVLPWENGPPGTLNGVPADEREAIAALVARAAPSTGPELVLIQHYPLLVPPEGRERSLAMVFWEESLLPLSVVKTINSGFRTILAPSSFVAAALINSGVAVPVAMTGYVPRLDAYTRLGAERAMIGERRAEESITFLHVSSCFPRKGVDVLLAAYVRAFRSSDPVRLVIKGFPNPHNDVEEQITALRAVDPDAPEITFINEDLTGEDLLALYRTADAMVLPARGEGFNMPAAEAMAAGIPLIVTGHGGHLDFCTDREAVFVDYSFAKSHSHFARAGSVWTEPDRDDLAYALRTVFTDLREGKEDLAERVMRAREAVRQRLDPARFADRIRDAMVGSIFADPPQPLRMAWVSTWDVACGIAEYSKFLLDGIGCFKAEIETTIFADSRSLLPASDGRRVHHGWTLGDPMAAGTLARGIAAHDSDVVVIQHQPGLLEWPQLAELLDDRRVRVRTTLVTLHAAARLMDLSEEERARIVTALQGATRLVVHRLSDLNLLKQLGLVSNVVLFPHGARPRWDAPAARPLRKGDAPIVGCFGFLAPGKGVDRLIEAAAALSTRWPGLRLRLLNALHPYAPPGVLAECKALAERLGIADRIEWETAFLPIDDALRRLATCDLVVLAYDESKESASGAVRIALAGGAPVAVTPARIFDEAGDAAYHFDRIDAAAVAEGIDTLFHDQELRKRYQERAAEWLRDHSWEDLGYRLGGMILGLRADHRLRH